MQPTLVGAVPVLTHAPYKTQQHSLRSDCKQHGGKFTLRTLNA